ncbi:hypothetical protein GCM10022254_61010 [Actinomadura meridiana]|uniref:Anaphase-promoting complex subunit 5 domain-containing protein n=1 Tax=Actinomadura meridiana TaxID=559626 RepID=A0ABP8CIC1_9ACTN
MPLIVAGVVAAVVPMLPQSWPLAVRALLGVVGAIAAGAAGTYVSEVIAARRQAVEADRAATAEIGARQDELAGTRELTSSDEQSVTGLLRPERELVDFVGRADELGRLREWCLDETAFPVRLMTGKGGVGKTRLALRLAGSLPSEKWECQSVKPGDEVAAVKAAGLVEQRVLLLVDYAETRPGLAAMLTEVAAADAGGLRVLLLARQEGEWWTSLDTESDATRELAARTPVLELAAALDDRRDDVQVIEAALPFYAAALGRPVPEVNFTAASSERLPVLVLHAAALVAVLDDEQGTSGGRAAADLGVLDRLLGHERRLWDKAARRAALTVRLPVLEQVVAAAVLVLDAQNAGEESVRAMIRRVPDLARADEERVGAVAGWLRQLYPMQDGRVDLLRPDLLAERHAVNQLAAHELLRRTCFTGLEPDQAAQALTVLTRACAHHPDASGLIQQALRQDLTGLANAAITVAVQTGPRLGDLLAEVLDDAPVSIEELRRIAKAIPYPTVALAAADPAVTRRIRNLLPADAEPADVAHWSGQLSTALAQLGQREEALEAATEAVRIRRGLVADRPVAFLPNLATSLNNQSNRLSDLGRREEALDAIEEAVRIRRRLVADRSNSFLPDLAGSLNNQSICLSDLGRHEEALETITEAVDAYRDLVETRPDAFLPHLAMSLNGRSNRLAGLGRREEALDAIVEAVRIRRKLAEDRPDAFLPGLANSLNNQSNRLSDLGRHEEALEAVIEAVAVYRRLVEDRPDAFLPGLANSLNNQSNHLSDMGRREEALEAVTEAVRIRRKLAEDRPDAFLPDLASALNNQSTCLSDLRRREEALEAVTEAVQIRRGLAAERPDAFLPALATSLNNQSNRLAGLGHGEEALEPIVEAVRIRRKLAEDRPDALLPDLASSLNNLSVRLGNLERREEGLAAITEALRIRRRLAEARPRVHQSEVDQSQRVKKWLEDMPS